MQAPPSEPEPDEEHVAPAWVKLLALAAAMILLAFLLLHLTGNQLGGHR